MKVLFYDDYIKIYINRQYKDIDAQNFEKELKQFFQRLNKIYKLELTGFYIATVYIDKNYGARIEMNREEIDYIDYYDNQVDMTITFKEAEFLYQIDDNYYFNNKDNLDIIYKEDKMYTKIDKKLSFSQMAKLLEMTNEIILK